MNAEYIWQVNSNSFIFLLLAALYVKLVAHLTTLCLKKVPTFKLSVTLSNLNQFSKFLHCWEAYKICHKTNTTIPTSP